jgi:copper chaperone CopZ
MNIVKNTLLKINGVKEVAVELVPGSAEIICEDGVKANDLVSVINNNTSYRASFLKEEEVLPEEIG